jgi:hypothetical protein
MSLLRGMTPDGQYKPIIIDQQGYIGSQSASQLADGWSYAAASGGIEDTSDVALKAAAGIGRHNYLKSIDVMNADASVATEVVVKDGSTVIWRTYLPAMAASTAPVPIVRNFDPPLAGSNNTALNVACITTSAKVYANAQGFVGGAPNQVALNTNSFEEVYDMFGALVTTDGGEQVYLTPQ